MAGGQTSTTANFGYQNVSMEFYPNQTVHTCYVTVVKHSANYIYYYFSIHILSILPKQCTGGYVQIPQSIQ
jgi:hypothetical protein